MNVLESIKRFLGLKKKNNANPHHALSERRRGEVEVAQVQPLRQREAEEAPEHHRAPPRGTTSGATRQGQGQGGVRVVATGLVVDVVGGRARAKVLD